MEGLIPTIMTTGERRVLAERKSNHYFGYKMKTKLRIILSWVSPWQRIPYPLQLNSFPTNNTLPKLSDQLNTPLLIIVNQSVLN